MLATVLLVVGSIAPVRAQSKLEQAKQDSRAAQRELDAVTRKLQALRTELEKVADQLEAAQDIAKAEKQRMAGAQRALARQAASMYRTNGSAGVLVPLLGDGQQFVERMEFVDRVFVQQTNAIEDARQAATLYEESVKRIKRIAAEREKLLEASAAEQRKLDRRFDALKDKVDQLGGPRVTGGVACPVGRPRSFIDSWGAARSGGRSHQGTDIMAPHGTPAYAPVSGTVLTAGQGGSLGGIVYWIRAADGTAFYGAHLQTILVRSGQRVNAGDLVGRVGSTGNASSTGPHLHFERHPGGRGAAAVNPYPWVLAACN